MIFDILQVLYQMNVSLDVVFFFHFSFFFFVQAAVATTCAIRVVFGKSSVIKIMLVTLQRKLLMLDIFCSPAASTRVPAAVDC